MARAKAEGHRVVLVLATRGELGEHRARRARAGRDARPSAASRSCTPRPRSSASTGSSSSATATPGWTARPTNHDAESLRTRRRRRGRGPARRPPRATRTPTCSRSTTTTAATATPTTSRCTASASARPSSPGTKRVYESTMNRDHIQQLMARRADEMPDAPDAPDAAQMDDFGSPAVDHHHHRRRRATSSTASARRWRRTRARSRPTPSSWRCPLDAFREAFGTEWFIRRDQPGARRELAVRRPLIEPPTNPADRWARLVISTRRLPQP